MPQLPQFPCSGPYCPASVSHLSKLYRLILLITSWHGPYRKHLSQLFFCCCITWLLHGLHREHHFPVTPSLHVMNLLPSTRRVCRAIPYQRLLCWLHSSCLEQICHNVMRTKRQSVSCSWELWDSRQPVRTWARKQRNIRCWELLFSNDHWRL
jgi:hypothetical protein